MTAKIIIAFALLGAVAAAGPAEAVVLQTGECLNVGDQQLPCQGVYARVIVYGPSQYALVIVCVQGAVGLGCPVYQGVGLPLPLPYSGPYQDCYLYIFEGGPVEGSFLVCLPRL